MKHVLLIFCLLLMLAGVAGAFTVSGTVSGGQSSGTRMVLAIPVTLDTVYFTIALPFGNYPFTLLGLDAGGYRLMAYQDLNSNLLPDLNEPRGFYGGDSLAVLDVNANVTGINLVLQASSTPGFTGTISYSGSQTGLTYLTAYYTPDFAGVPHGAGTLLNNTGNGDYTAVVDSLATYYVQAYMDANGNFQWDAGEPYGIYGGDAAVPVTVTSTVTPSGINFTLMDTDAAPGPASALPSSFGLAAYPNPFNSTTRIRFTLSASAPVEVKLFDTQGRDVRTLARGTFTAGAHELLVEAQGLSSGVYFVRLSSPDRTESQPLILLR
jgi:hypothetical protein